MSADNFDACFAIILESEGGFVQDSQDPGGATNLGITIGTLSDWLGRPATVDEVRALTPATVAPIYKARYWATAHCDDLPKGVDLSVFDFAVNAGVGRAVRTLQEACGAVVDGQIGPHTLAAVNAMGPSLISAYAAMRNAFYESLPTFAHFGKGWLARTARTAELAAGMLTAP